MLFGILDHGMESSAEAGLRQAASKDEAKDYDLRLPSYMTSAGHMKRKRCESQFMGGSYLLSRWESRSAVDDRVVWMMYERECLQPLQFQFNRGQGYCKQEGDIITSASTHMITADSDICTHDPIMEVQKACRDL